MENEINFEDLKTNFQVIMDSIASKNFQKASEKLIFVKEMIDEMIDFAKKDTDLIAISKYQVLLQQLQEQLQHLN
jgi:hypothetical protein